MKISIITVCYNAERYIERAIKSVVAQSYKDIEYIVIDGNSTDNTLSIVNSYRDDISCIISEEDEGIYDAMNKGIAMASGDLLFFLNSDDFFVHSDVVGMAVSAIGQQVADIYFGDILILDADGKIRCEWHDKIDKFGVFSRFPPMPGLFYSRGVFDKVGLFSTDYRTVSDYLWIVSAFVEHNVKAVYLNMAISVFQLGGVSSISDARDMRKMEIKAVRDLYFSKKNWTLYKLIVKRRKRNFATRFIARFVAGFITLKKGALGDACEST